MSYTLYINKPNKRARLHEENCERLKQHHNSNGDNGEYRYYSEYQKAWDKMNALQNNGYNCGDCSYCEAGN